MPVDFTVCSIDSKLNPGYTRVYFSGLDKDKCYSVSGFDEFFYGDELMNAGIKVSLSKFSTMCSRISYKIICY